MTVESKEYQRPSCRWGFDERKASITEKSSTDGSHQQNTDFLSRGCEHSLSFTVLQTSNTPCASHVIVHENVAERPIVSRIK